MWWKTLLLLAVAGILTLFALGLGNDPRLIPTPLINRPATDFTAPALDGGEPIRLSAHKGRWVMLNFWGSWCGSCWQEHPYLVELSKKVQSRNDFVIIGVDFRDTIENGRDFLRRYGETGYRHAFDPDQRIAIDWGVYGAPESYLVDPQGRIRLKHTGPLYPGWFEKVALPLMSQEKGIQEKTP
ncbi:MAG: DsbE family thiol:disulfide interchange protein [Magnetococcus sp. DMHC-1]|nr:DsbE family thiol:disulfide interchange protein [Magnetococcales bacterium]